MKILLFIIFINLFIFNNSYPEEIIDCTKFKKLSVKFLDCKAKKLKNEKNINFYYFG